MSFTEDWFSLTAAKSLIRLAKRTNYLPGRVVEVGSWEGKSTIALSHAVHPADVNAVDTWQGSPGEISHDLAKERDVFATFHKNIGELTRGNVIEHRMDWRDYFTQDQSPVRFLFIDATHTYDEVFDNIKAAMPLMVRGGIICGDDAHHEPVIRAAKDCFGFVDTDTAIWFWEA